MRQEHAVWVLNYLDQAMFRASNRTNLDGTIEPMFEFSEVYDGNAPNVQPYIRKDLAEQAQRSARPTRPSTAIAMRSIFRCSSRWRRT